MSNGISKSNMLPKTVSAARAPSTPVARPDIKENWVQIPKQSEIRGLAGAGASLSLPSPPSPKRVSGSPDERSGSKDVDPTSSGDSSKPEPETRQLIVVGRNDEEYEKSRRKKLTVNLGVDASSINFSKYYALTNNAYVPMLNLTNYYTACDNLAPGTEYYQRLGDSTRLTHLHARLVFHLLKNNIQPDGTLASLSNPNIWVAAYVEEVPPIAGEFVPTNWSMFINGTWPPITDLAVDVGWNSPTDDATYHRRKNPNVSGPIKKIFDNLHKFDSGYSAAAGAPGFAVMASQTHIQEVKLPLNLLQTYATAGQALTYYTQINKPWLAYRSFLPNNADGTALYTLQMSIQVKVNFHDVQPR